MDLVREKAAVVAFFVGCAFVGVAGCETSQLASHAVSGAPLRADQIVFRGPIIISEFSGGRLKQTTTIPEDDPLVLQLNEWAKRTLAGAHVNIVNYAPQFTMHGENFEMNLSGSGVVLDLWRRESSGGCWSTDIEAQSDPMLKILWTRLASSLQA